MKAFSFTIVVLYEKVLYIPHGSDERKIGVSLAASIKNFISHMVQMKVE